MITAGLPSAPRPTDTVDPLGPVDLTDAGGFTDAVDRRGDVDCRGDVDPPRTADPAEAADRTDTSGPLDPAPRAVTQPQAPTGQMEPYRTPGGSSDARRAWAGQRPASGPRGPHLPDTHVSDTHLSDTHPRDARLRGTHLPDTHLLGNHSRDTHLLDARDRLARRVLARVGADGLLTAPCESRVLESALLLHLVTGLTPADPARDRLTRYLEHTLDTAPPDPIQRAVARAVLGEAVGGDVVAGAAATGEVATGETASGEAATGEAETERVLSRFAHFTAARKRRMFQTLLAHLGAAPWPSVPLEAYEARGQQSWLALEMAALKILAAHGTGRTEALTPHDWAALAPALHTGPVWESNHLARLLGLLALRTDPGRRTEVAAAVTRVAGDLRPDGGLPFITGMDIFATATGGLALTAAGYGAHPAVPRMGFALAAQQHEDGGFGFTRGVRQSDADDTAYAVEFLRATAPVRHGAVIEAAEDYLMRLANSDGGIPTFARGIDSETAMTAGAVNALAPSPRCRPTVEAAARFLTGEEGTAALHERSWSRNVTNAAHRTVLACDSLAALTAPPQSLSAHAPRTADRTGTARQSGITASYSTMAPQATTAPRAATPRRSVGPQQAPTGPQPVSRQRLDALRARLLAHLLERRLPDGGWGHEDTGPSDPISTAYATVALARAPGRSAELRAAVDYLVARQRPDGGFDSVPDQAGPRPLLYDAPALADNCVLLAWGHALGRRTVPRP